MIRFVADVEVDYWNGVPRAIRLVFKPVAWPKDVSRSVH